jgi:uncharacterized protein
MITNPPPLSSRRSFLKAAGACAAGGLAMGPGSFLYATKVEPYWLDVNPVHLHLPDLDPEFDGYRIAQISDLHVDHSGWMTSERLGGIVDIVNEQKPDLAVMTGDFVTGPPFEKIHSEILVGALGRLTPRDQSLAVPGNHDYWTDIGHVRRVMRETDMINLAGRVHTVCRGGAVLHFAGMDDLWRKPVHPHSPWSHRSELEELIRRIPTRGAAILLVHEPDFADVSAASGRFALQLSGHSHGGQVNIPLLGPIHLPALGRKYHTGKYQVGRMIQYTNRGTGMIPRHVRFNCRPEITMITLHTA